jgi:hypothetical protein
MANPEHVEVVKQGAEAIRKWREKNLGVPLELYEADLSRADLSEVDLSQIALGRANLTETILFKADLRGANLSGATLIQADLGRANLTEANLNEANLSGATLGNANLSQATLVGATLSGANLAGTNLCKASLRDADLSGATLAQATLTEAELARANLSLVRGSHQAHDLETVRLKEGDANYFETCRRPWPECRIDWERLKVMGRLPLFGISYTALILIPIIFYGLALYNRYIDLVHAWAKEAIASPDHPLHRLAPRILEHLHHLTIPSLSFVLFVSTILLAAASTMYTASCPPRIKEFSRGQWCDQFGRSLLHYWPLAWKHRYIRLTCAACYALGGTGALLVLGTKVWKTALFILQHSTFPWPWR